MNLQRPLIAFLCVICVGLFVYLTSIATYAFSILPRVVSTPTPTAGIGVPLVAGNWQITVDKAAQDSEVSRGGLTITPGGGLSFSTTTTQAGEGRVFLILETTFRHLGSSQPEEILVEDVKIKDETGKYYEASEFSDPADEFVFLLNQDSVDQLFEFHFRDAPPIPFRIDEQVEHGIQTEFQPGLDSLPAVCEIEKLVELSGTSHLTIQQQTESGLSLGHIDANGTNLTSACADMGFGTLQYSLDQAALVKIYPHRGWSDLYLIEPNGQVYALVKNGLEIQVDFDPSTRWVLFSTKKIGEPGQILQVFDRDTASTTLIKSAEDIDFELLNDGRLVIDYRETEDSDRVYEVGLPSGENLTPLLLPEEIPGYAFAAGNGRNLVYHDLDSSFSGFSLVITDIDGQNAQTFARSDGLHLRSQIAPDNRAILIGIQEGERGNRIELHNLATQEKWTLASGVEDEQLSFSNDGRWGSIVAVKRNKSILYLVDTSTGEVREVENVINAYFSPDSTQLAYTVQQPNIRLEMFIFSLLDKSSHSLGMGEITGWLPEEYSRPPTPVPTATPLPPTSTSTSTATSPPIPPTATAIDTATDTATSTATSTKIPLTSTPLPPTSVPTSTSISIPTSTPTEVAIVVVRVRGLNLRAGPGTTHQILDVISQGNELRVIGEHQSCLWLQVNTSQGITGWVSGSTQYVTYTTSCDEIRKIPSRSNSSSTLAVPTPTSIVRAVRQSLVDIYVENDTDGLLCFHILGVSLGERCFPGGSHYYGNIPMGTYTYTVSARCGSATKTKVMGTGGKEFRFWCTPSL